MPSLTAWKWTLRPALSYVGQGMIMGGRPAASLLVGALVGWGYLGPRARASGAAPGKIFDFERGAQGYVLWVAIALMVSEALMTLFLVTIDQVAAAAKATSGSPRSKGGGGASSSSKGHDVEVAPPSQLVPTSWWLAGVVGATALCAAVVSPLFGIPPYQIVVAVALSCLVAVLAVRALGQTDLNPVSGVGKLSQIAFALVAPGHVVTNIVAGALAEAGAMQAGDLMQDLKAGHLLRASPRAQFYGQLVGATASIFVTVGVYQLYERAYGVPSELFTAPVANVWKDMALLMRNGLSALPPSSLAYAKAFASLGAALPSSRRACRPRPPPRRLSPPVGHVAWHRHVHHARLHPAARRRRGHRRGVAAVRPRVAPAAHARGGVGFRAWRGRLVDCAARAQVARRRLTGVHRFSEMLRHRARACAHPACGVERDPPTLAGASTVKIRSRVRCGACSMGETRGRGTHRAGYLERPRSRTCSHGRYAQCALHATPYNAPRRSSLLYIYSTS